MPRPFFIHALSDIYHPDCKAQLPDGRWVAAVGEPYTAGRLQAAWWVLTGRAFAFRWPKAGDLEDYLYRRKPDRVDQKASPFVSRQADKPQWSA